MPPSSKTKTLVISRKLCPPLLSLHVDNTAIPAMDTFQYLSVTLSRDLTWSDHIVPLCCWAKCINDLSVSSLGWFTQPGMTLLELSFANLVYACAAEILTRKICENVQQFAARPSIGPVMKRLLWRTWAGHVYRSTDRTWKSAYVEGSSRSHWSSLLCSPVIPQLQHVTLTLLPSTVHFSALNVVKHHSSAVASIYATVFQIPSPALTQILLLRKV